MLKLNINFTNLRRRQLETLKPMELLLTILGEI